jgi:lysozyme
MLDQTYLDAIKGFEGYSPQAQWDYKQSSSGYGTKAQPGDENIPPDQLKAIHEQRFQDEVGKAAQSVDSFAPGLPAGTRAALISLTYNAGPGWQQSGLGQAVKGGDLDKARDLFLQYNKAGGEVNPGLVNRRQTEAGWFGAGMPAQAPQAAPQAPLTLPSAQAPVFPTQAVAAPQGPGQAPVTPQFEMPQAPPIFYAPRRVPNLTGLQQALGNRGFFFPSKG